MANTRLTQFFYTKHTMPVLIDCNFIVDATNGNGLGLRSLKGPGVVAAYGHTSSTPAAGNPNPAVGYFIIQLQDNYNRYYGGFSGFISQLSGSSILVASAGVVANTTYVITILGTTTTAGWQSLGLPVGIAPAVGVAFVATATATATGTGAVQVPNVNGSGVGNIEVVGDPNLTLSPSNVGATATISSPYIIVRTVGPTSSSVTTPIAKAPADGATLGLSFYLSNSSVIVAGE